MCRNPEKKNRFFFLVVFFCLFFLVCFSKGYGCCACCVRALYVAFPLLPLRRGSSNSSLCPSQQGEAMAGIQRYADCFLHSIIHTERPRWLHHSSIYLVARESAAITLSLETCMLSYGYHAGSIARDRWCTCNMQPSTHYDCTTVGSAWSLHAVVDAGQTQQQDRQP